MPFENPADGRASDEAALEAAASGFFSDAAKVPAGKVQAAIRAGTAEPIFNSAQWKKATERLRISYEKAELPLAEAGLRSGAAEIPRPAPRLGARIGELAEAVAGERAVEMAQAIDEKTRRGLRLLIGRASREYAGNQSLAVLRNLEKEIRASIGLTPKQAARIERWRSAAKEAGLSDEAILAGVKKRSESAIALRARAIGERGVVESISAARHRSWVEARETGELPRNVRKRWMTQGDKGVRASHRAQARAGSIPLDDVYPIQQVLHPPSLDPGCRCWEVLVIPAEEEAAVAEAPAPTVEEAPRKPTAAAETARLREVFSGIERQIAEELSALDDQLAEASTRRWELGKRLERLDEPNAVEMFDDIVRGLPEGAQKLVIDAAREQWFDDFNAAMKRESEVRIQRRAIEASARTRAHEALKVAEPKFSPVVQYKAKLDAKRRGRIEEGLAWLRSVLDREAPDRTLFVRAPTDARYRQRSYASGDSIHMAVRADSGTTVHEVGHWLERDEEVLRRSIAFLRRRTEGNQLERLADIYKGHGYRADELAWRDKFTHAYVGKRYEVNGVPTSSEILSMGLESMFRDPIKFLKEDEDFFSFVLGFMRGLD